MKETGQKLLLFLFKSHVCRHRRRRDAKESFVMKILGSKHGALLIDRYSSCTSSN